MTTIFSKSHIDREKLKEIILKNPSCLSPYLKFIDTDLYTEEGSIDFLGVDKAGRLVIVNFDIEESNEALISVLSQVQWLKKCESLIKRLFSSEKVDFTLPPQIFLVASCFSDKLKSAAKQISMQDIKLIQFKYLINKTQEAIYFEEIFYNQVDSKHISPISREKAKVKDSTTFKSSIDQKEKKTAITPESEGIPLSPEEIAEFMNFDKTLEKEKTSE